MGHNKREVFNQRGCESGYFVKLVGHHLSPLLLKGFAIVGLSTPLRPSTANPQYSRVHKGIVRTQPFHSTRDGGGRSGQWECIGKAMGTHWEGKMRGSYEALACRNNL